MQKCANFVWTDEKREACQLLAQDKLSDAKIAAKVGVHRNALLKWKGNPEFAAHRNALVEERNRRLWRKSLADDEALMDDLEEGYEAHHKVRLERGADPTMAEVPGGTTGLIVRDFKTVGTGPKARTVPVYTEDHGWVQTLIRLQDQARKILGKEKAGPNVAVQVNNTINVTETAEWKEARDELGRVLERFPEARAEVLRVLGHGE